MSHTNTMREKQWAYAFLRIAMGIDYFGHGFIRVFHGTGNFAQWMVSDMAGVPFLLPGFVRGFGYVVPWVELAIGLMLLLGLRTRIALTSATLLMFCLMTGTALKQDWGGESLQLGYVFYLAVLLFLAREYDTSWVRLLGRNRSSHDAV